MKTKPSALLGAAVSGVLAALAFPKADQMFLAWIALIPLFFLLTGKKPGGAFLTGWTAGTFFYGVLLYWIPAVPAHYGGLSTAVSLLVFLALILFLGLTWGLFGLGFAVLNRKLPAASFWIAPCLWVGGEYILTHAFTGFPWGVLGLSQVHNILLIQVSTLTGVYGVSFFLVLFQSLFVGAVRTSRRGFFAAGIVAMVLVHLGGWISLRTPGEGPGDFTAAVIQGNVPSDLDWNLLSTGEIRALFEAHLDLTREMVRRGARFVAWPEFSVPLCFSCGEGIHRELAEDLAVFARETGVTLLLGTNEVSGPAERRSYFNAAVNLTPDGPDTRYAKMHLVPFGEYTPYKNIFGFIERLTHAIGEVTPGTERVLHRFEGRPFGSPICYEIVFPDLVRRFVKDGASFLVTITNDGWYGRSSGPYQHFAHAVFRAVENRRFLLRAATTGISGIIDPFGRVLEASEIGVRTGLVGTISPSGRLTAYARLGDVFAAACLTLALLSVILSFFKRSP